MASSPKCSVVVPAFNAERTVGNAVRSALVQSVAALEVIVVDDGSEDATADVVESIDDGRVRLRRQANLGLAGARNAGIAMARGEFVSFLDADDLWMPHYVERMTGALIAEPEAALAYCDAWMFEEGTGRVRAGTFFDLFRPSGPLPSNPRDFFLAHLRRNFFYVGTTVRRAVLEEVGGFREDLSSLEDYELWLRIELRGWRVVEVSAPLALYRISPDQMSRDDARMAENLLSLCSVLERHDLPAGAQAILNERRRNAAREIRAVTRTFSPTGIHRRGRVALRHVTRALNGTGLWMASPPRPVESTFPDLGSR